MSVDRDFWAGKRVLLTGHTGFKGGWAALWLSDMGAQVFGLALDPPTEPSLFAEAGVAARLARHTIADVRDLGAVERAFADSRPDIVLHMAAQPLVRASYAIPVETYAVNVMGTVHLLDAARRAAGVRAFVNVTTDKCYENLEWHWGYRERDQLGGHDPYSNSKACSELVTAAFRSSYGATGEPWIASARAGNVIGGGDWALDRIVPDAMRALDRGAPLQVRNPGAIRPWQHVLEPVAGYLTLAQRLFEDGEAFAQAWNFGPGDDDAQPVGWILDRLTALDPGLTWATAGGTHPHEAGYLKLDSSKSRAALGWRPRWPLADALALTLDWHRAWRKGGDMRQVSLDQIARYTGAEDGGR